MRVAAFVHLQRTLISRHPTGVGKHINNVVPRLARAPGVDLRVLAVREELTADGRIPDDSPLCGLPVAAVPWGRRTVEASWLMCNWPAASRWAGPVDWVYCPAEAYVAAGRAKLAVTAHSSVCFEPNMPWSDRPSVRRDRRRLGPRFRRLRDRATCVLTVSQFLSDRLTDLFGIAPQRLRVVGNGVEDDYYAPGPLPERWSAATARPYVLAVGGLMQWKGADAVLALADELERRRSPLRVVVAGHDEPQYEGPAAARGHLCRLGYVGVEDGLAPLMAGATAVYVPSLYETYGIPAAEAMAAGAPVVTSRHPALLEVTAGAGVTVEPAEASAVADVMDNLLRDAALRAKSVAAGRARAEAHRWSACAARVAGVLRGLS
jgi:glycosyltransferase involved in cell wall biosynthesis